MVLSSEENLENVKKLESLLRFDFTLTNQIITYNFLKPSYYDFFNLFLYWFDFPVQSLLLRGLRYFLDYKDYDSDIENILTSLAETCHDVLSRVEPKSLKKENLKDLEKVIEELNNEILGMLKGLKGFNGLQISEANWWENEALKKIKKLFNELSGEKEFHEKKILVAFKISIYLQLSSLIQGKNKLFYDTLFGMLTFLSNFFF